MTNQWSQCEWHMSQLRYYTLLETVYPEKALIFSFFNVFQLCKKKRAVPCTHIFTKYTHVIKCITAENAVFVYKKQGTNIKGAFVLWQIWYKKVTKLRKRFLFRKPLTVLWNFLIYWNVTVLRLMHRFWKWLINQVNKLKSFSFTLSNKVKQLILYLANWGSEIFIFAFKKINSTQESSLTENLKKKLSM